MSLSKKTGKAIVWDLGGTFVKQLGTLGVSMVLARILTPEEFGIVGMVLVILVIAEVFVDFGLGSALIQRQDVNNLTYSSAFFINVLLGFLFTAVLFLVAPLIGAFYENERVVSIARMLSVVFLINSFNHVQIAILKKELDFKSLSIRTVISSIGGGVVGLIMAFLDFGIYSLVAQHISTAVFGLVLLWSISKWKPDFQFSKSELKKLSSFGSYMFLDRLNSSIFKRLDVVVVGKLFAPAVLGYFTRAQSLRDLILKYTSSSVTKIFYPVLSKFQNDPQEFKKVYFRLLKVLAFLSFGITGGLYLSSRDIILILFGDQWEDSIVIFQLLALATVLAPLDAQMINAFISRGKAKENFKIGLFRKSLRVLLLIVAYYHGLNIYLLSLAGLNVIIAMINITFMAKYIDIDIWKHVKIIFHCLPPLMLFVFLYHFLQMDSVNLYYRTGLTISFGVTYFVYGYVTKHDGLMFSVNKATSMLNKFSK